jgi:hypothetical protein
LSAGAKYKNVLNDKYSKVHYSNNNAYTKDDIKHDFNVYYAIKIILDKFEFRLALAVCSIIGLVVSML